MTREEALTANVALDTYAVALDAANVAYAAYVAELDRINKEYPL